MLERDGFGKSDFWYGERRKGNYCVRRWRFLLFGGVFRENNKLLKVLVPNKKYSSLLRRFRDYIVHAGDFRSKVEDKQRLLKHKKERE